MKVSKARYMDDNVSIQGVLIKRFLRKPVFYVSDPCCVWSHQVITKAKQDNVVIMLGECGSGKARRSGCGEEHRCGVCADRSTCPAAYTGVCSPCPYYQKERELITK